jgi:hypothetical protein
MRFIVVETCYFQVKDPDVKGKTVYDTWSTMNGGINVRICFFLFPPVYDIVVTWI